MSNNRGERNRLLSIEALVGTVDAANQPINEWQLFLKRWGEPRTASGMSVVRGSTQGIDAPVGRYSWRINYTPDITTAHRALHKNTVYDIVDVRHDHANREYTDLICNERANNG